MLYKIKRNIRVKLGLPISSKINGEKGIIEIGHRKYVGGKWDEMGLLQFQFLIKQGLKPEDVFLDIACGSLRAGIHVIPYLNKGNYLGIEKEKLLIDKGVKCELNAELKKSKQPELIVSDSFEFELFSKKPNYAIAQSLFSHLPANMINDCLLKLSKNFVKGGAFYATFFTTDKKIENPKESHDHGTFRFTNEEITKFGTNNGWDVYIIGDWKHPRKQIMVQYTLK